MITDEILIEIFLFIPSDELFSIIDNKDIAISELSKLEQNSETMLIRWKYSMREIRAVDIIAQAVKEKNLNVVNYLIDFFDNYEFYFFVCCVLYSYKVDHGFIIEKCKRCEDDEWIMCDLSIATSKEEMIEMQRDIGYDFAFQAALYGYEDLVDKEIIAFDDDCHYFMGDVFCEIADGAARGGHKKILDKVVDYEGKTHSVSHNDVASSAARGGHYVIVLEILAKMKENNKIVNYNKIASSAARGGHLVIVKKMIAGFDDSVIIRADNYQLIAENAAMGGHKVVVEYLINNYDIDKNKLKFNHHLDAALYFRDK